MRNRTENQIDLALIRHGMTASNSEKRYLGRTNEPLSEEGRRLLLLRKEQGCYPAASFLFSGPMTRCLQTGRLLYPEKTPLLIPEWTEMDFGEFEGKNYRELSGDARYQAWIDSGGLLPFPGGESREAFLLRCRKGLERLLRMLEKKGPGEMAGNMAAAIVHGGTIMALLSALCGGDYFDYQAANGHGYICRLSVEPEGGGTVKAAEIRGRI